MFGLQGKVFPKLRKRSSAARLMEQDRNGEDQTAADYVFRIVYPGYRYDASKRPFTVASPGQEVLLKSVANANLCVRCSAVVQ